MIKKIVCLIAFFAIKSSAFAQVFLPVDLTFNKLPIHSILVDEQNQKWVGTEKGVFIINEVTEKAQVSLSSALPKKSIVLTRKVSSGAIYFATYDNQLIKFKNDKYSSEQLDFLKGKLVSGILSQRNSTWIASRGTGLWKKVNNGSSYSKVDLDEDYINDMTWFGSKIWIAGESGLFYEKKTKKFKSENDFDKAFKLLVHKDKLWVVGLDKDRKVVLRSTKNGKDWMNHSLPNAFEYQPPQAIAMSKEGVLWIGADRLASYQNKKWKTYSSQQGFQSKSALCLAIDENDNVWAGTEGRGLFVRVVYPEALRVKESDSLAEKPVDNIVSLDGVSQNENLIGKKVRLQVQFKTATATILPEYEKELQKLVDILRENSGLKILVTGHTAPLGNPKKNQELSEKRAIQVKKYLIGRGVKSNRIRTKGLGGSEPISTALERMQENRRVEVIFVE